jgi:hypothetical protein
MKQQVQEWKECTKNKKTLVNESKLWYYIKQLINKFDEKAK